MVATCFKFQYQCTHVNKAVLVMYFSMLYHLFLHNMDKCCISSVRQVGYLAEPPSQHVPTGVTLYISNYTGATLSLRLTRH